MAINDEPGDAFAPYSVPSDFPRSPVVSSLAGYQPKLALVTFEGKYYLPGDTPPERYFRWDACEHLALQIVGKSRESKAGKRAHMYETEILDQYCERLLKTGWHSDEEMRWVIRRAAELLGWPIPPSAVANAGMPVNKCDQ